MPDPALPSAGLPAYEEQGYLILRKAFRPERIQALRDAVDRLIDRALTGAPEIPWIDRSRRLPARLAHLLHPDRYDHAFAEWLDQDLSPQIQSFLCGSPPRHSLFGMLAGGGEVPYRQAWHRDIARPGASDEEAFLRRHHGRFIQFNAPLLPEDRFLNIVPGSHLRASRPEEIVAANAGDLADMAGAMVVHVEPGDIVYYNANLWHRGWNPQGVKRWTLHCAFWRSEYPVMKHEHGQREAMLSPGHMDRMPVVTRAYIERYLGAYPGGEPRSLLDL